MVAMIRWSIRSEKCRQSTAGDFNDSGRLPGLSLRLDEDRPLGRLRKEIAVAFTAARFRLGLMEDEIIQNTTTVALTRPGELFPTPQILLRAFSRGQTRIAVIRTRPSRSPRPLRERGRG